MKRAGVRRHSFFFFLFFFLSSRHVLLVGFFLCPGYFQDKISQAENMSASVI